MKQDIYEQLALHLSALGMGLPYREELLDILRENFTQIEAEVALTLPTKVIPLQPVKVDDIIGEVNLPRVELVDILERLSERGLLFSGKTKDGEKGYALLQKGFGFPQTFFWKGEKTPHAENMADLIDKYDTPKVKKATHGTNTHAYRYLPVKEAIELMTQEVHPHEMMEAVYPYDMMEKVIERARVIALAHCPCRVRAHIQERGCDHLLEVCLKFDELAEYLIERGLGKEITREEALEVIKKSAEDGLVHFVDNAQGDIQHSCNCCGCCCWNLGPIKRREITRDLIIATYFIEELDEDKCNGCGKCVDICPVNVITIEDDLAVIDRDWCVGCGLCVTRCKLKATKLIRRSEQIPPPNFRELHERILQEKGLS
ncbi:4Fe-4S binding protein [Chloroflexota bacterium]